MFAEEEAVLLREAADGLDALELLTRRREAGEPLEVVVGWAEFAGLRLVVAPGVFVPRPRSEALVDVAVPLVRAGDTVLDVCCGVGALGAALEHRVPGIDLHAADLDAAAVACAAANLGPERVSRGDLFAAFPPALRGRAALVLANAPYVPTAALATLPPEAREHEPRAALDGGADGLDLHRRIARDAAHWLAPGGHLVIETSAAQAPTASGIMRDAGLAPRVVHDDERETTVVVGTRAV